MKKWLENYWYHYKWRTIIALFLLLIVIFCVVSAIDTKKYDGYIMIVGNKYLTKSILLDMEESFDKVTKDIGESNVINFSQMYYDPLNNENFQANKMARETLATMAIQTYYIYIMSIDVYEIYKDTGVFERLENVFDVIPNSAYDEYAINFNDTEFSKKNAGVDSLGDEMVMVLKVVPYTRTQSSKRRELELYEYHKEIFINIVNYRE